MQILIYQLIGSLVLSVSLCSTLSLAADPVLLVTMGGGFLNGFGIQRAEALPGRLETDLAAAGHPVTVSAMNLMDTTTSAVPKLLAPDNAKYFFRQPDRQAAILETGPFDCQLDPGPDTLAHTRDALDQTLAILAERKIPVLVVGTEALSWCPAGYDKAAYAAIFPALAAKYGDLLYPSLLEGVSGNPDLIQPGLDDPNAKGYAIIEQKMLPVVEQLIARIKEP